jgi:membrane-bound ClpP family serine protease
MNELLATVTAQTGDGDQIYLLWGFIGLAGAIAFVLLELFIPSGGLIGLLAAGSLILSIVSFFMYDSVVGVIALCAYVFIGPVVAFYGFKMWLGSGMAKRLVLGGDNRGGMSASSEEAAMASERARRERVEKLRALIGSEGVAATALRPVGTVVIEGERVDALAEEGVIEPDMPIVVIDAYDNQLKVRRK